MASLTAKQESFIKLMTESEELARRGFDLLLKRSDFERFFYPLKDAGLFEPTRNPAPVPVEPPGSYRIAYWSALDYLVAVARVAGERTDDELATKVLDVVRSVSTWREADGKMRDNYQTWRQFAEILGLVPTRVLSVEDLELIPLWLGTRFDRGIVGRTLDAGVVKRLVESDSCEDWDRAVAILEHCTAIRLEDAREPRTGRHAPIMRTEDLWLRDLVHRHSGALGARIGAKVAQLFLRRLREAFSDDDHDNHSTLYRAAIEDHVQNHSWPGPEDISVEGLRDGVLSWCDHDSDGAKAFVERLLGHQAQIARRIGIYVLDQRWEVLGKLYVDFLGPQLFDPGNLHELYNLLSRHFESLGEDTKARTVGAIREIASPSHAEDPTRYVKQAQRRWLSAIASKGYRPADEWFRELEADRTLGALPEHPNFHFYAEVWSGPGPTPISVQELIAFAADGDIVDRLNAFAEPDSWRGPTTRALVEALEEAIRVTPERFVDLLPRFLVAKRPFQHAVISGLKGVWESAAQNPIAIDWDRAWQQLVTFFEQLIADAVFWTESVLPDRGLTANRDWIPPIIAEFLQAGTRRDEHAYSPDLLSRAWSLILILLQHSKPVDQPSDEAMNQAINSSKGKAIEALFCHVLRVCRLRDRASGAHAEAWAEMRPVVDAELARCSSENYEFSTLCGAYLANLDYIDREWLRANLKSIFPVEFPANGICAVDGLAHSPHNLPVYRLLVEAEVLDWALRAELKGRYTRGALIERIALAYLRGDEELDSPRFSYLFEASRVKDLEDVSRFFWSVKNERLSDAQNDRVIQFWERCVRWSGNAAAPPGTLLASLGALSAYLTTADGRDRYLLEAVAPYVHVGHGTHMFIADLVRLVDVSPDGVSIVLGKLLESQVPFFDYEGHLKSLLMKLADKDHKQAAISYAERARELPGMQEVYDRLTRAV